MSKETSNTTILERARSSKVIRTALGGAAIVSAAAGFYVGSRNSNTENTEDISKAPEIALTSKATLGGDSLKHYPPVKLGHIENINLNNTIPLSTQEDPKSFCGGIRISPGYPVYTEIKGRTRKLFAAYFGGDTMSMDVLDLPKGTDLNRGFYGYFKGKSYRLPAAVKFPIPINTITDPDNLFYFDDLAYKPVAVEPLAKETYNSYLINNAGDVTLTVPKRYIPTQPEC